MNDDPKDLLPVKSPPIPIDIAEPMVSDEEAEKALLECGLVRVPKKQLDNLNKLGIWLKGAGVLRNQRGEALFNQRRLDDVMQILYEHIVDINGSKRKDKMKSILLLSEKLGYLSSKMTESQKLVVEMEGLTPGSARNAAYQDEAVNKSFIPGSNVKPMIVGKEIHIHQAPQNQPTGPGF